MFFYNIYLYIKYLSIYEIFRYEIVRKIFTKIFVNVIIHRLNKISPLVGISKVCEYGYICGCRINRTDK